MARHAYARPDRGSVPTRHPGPRPRRGIWASEFVKPWEWRRGKRIAANDKAPGQCRIKGNINAKGERIYHMPGQRAYGATRIKPAKGERFWEANLEMSFAADLADLSEDRRAAVDRAVAEGFADHLDGDAYALSAHMRVGTGVRAA